MSATGRFGVGRGRSPATGRDGRVGRLMMPCAVRRSITGVASRATIRATGVPRSVMTTSFPSRAASIHWPRWALSSVTATSMRDSVHPGAVPNVQYVVDSPNPTSARCDLLADVVAHHVPVLGLTVWRSTCGPTAGAPPNCMRLHGTTTAPTVPRHRPVQRLVGLAPHVGDPIVHRPGTFSLAGGQRIGLYRCTSHTNP